jgi:hypothetical protein
VQWDELLTELVGLVGEPVTVSLVAQGRLLAHLSGRLQAADDLSRDDAVRLMVRITDVGDWVIFLDRDLLGEVGRTEDGSLRFVMAGVEAVIERETER